MLLLWKDIFVLPHSPAKAVVIYGKITFQASKSYDAESAIEHET